MPPKGPITPAKHDEATRAVARLRDELEGAVEVVVRNAKARRCGCVECRAVGSQAHITHRRVHELGIHDDVGRREGDCDGLLCARNCIYAAYGNVFKTAAWKDRFTKEPWYKPNPKFEEKTIPAVRGLRRSGALAAEAYQRVLFINEEDVGGIDTAVLDDVRASHRNLSVHEKTTYASVGIAGSATRI